MTRNGYLTRPVSARDYMDRKEFTLGVIDARAGRPFRKVYETWPPGVQKVYESGRQLAQVLPPDMKTRTSNGKPNPKAVRILEKHFRVVL